jgi:PadR family transcriptional regulator, regulatory protein PadR
LRPRSRSRRPVRPGHWEVRARVERFIEPSLLLLLRERPVHGYELAERLGELAGEDEPVGAGNLYRILRALEDEGIVKSEWDAELPGPAKRTYALTPAGGRLLDSWATALQETQEVIGTFVKRYEREGS